MWSGVRACWELVWWSCPLHTSRSSHYVAGVLVTTEKLDHCFRIVWITFSCPVMRTCTCHVPTAGPTVLVVLCDFLYISPQTLSELLSCYICADQLRDASLCPHCSKIGCYLCIKVSTNTHKHTYSNGEMIYNGSCDNREGR